MFPDYPTALFQEGKATALHCTGKQLLRVLHWEAIIEGRKISSGLLS
jgi:hypothetical protein